jgi:hypothetical protein
MIFGAINSLFTSRKQKKAAAKINPVRDFYQVSSNATDTVNTARQEYNARMAGAIDQERNIAAAQAATLNNVNQNATDSAQALALAGQSQLQANDAYGRLGIQEKQNKYGLLQNLNAANAGMTAEKDKVYQDKLDFYKEQMAQKQALLNASQQNKAGAFGAIDNLIGTAAGIFAGGGFGGLMGGKGGGLMGGLKGSMPQGVSNQGPINTGMIPLGGFGMPMAGQTPPIIFPTWRTNG